MTINLVIPTYLIESLTTDKGKYLKQEDVADFMLELAKPNPALTEVFIILSQTLSGRQPKNLTAVLTAEKSESVGNVVPEAGIEPATKGL